MILVTGGAGYVGSHTCKALAQAREEHIVFDNLSTGHDWAVKWGTLFRGDICNLHDLRTCFQRYPIQEVVHFAALSLVGESGIKPAEYYETNVIGTLNLLRVMKEFEVRSIVFSSSAAVYGEPEEIPIPESHPLRPVNVYGRTKVMMEQLMADFQLAYGLNFAALRYFNAAGADPDGEIGEVHEPETHLIPNVLRTALGIQEMLDIYGTDYPTPDGSPIRDYIHVTDLAEAHLLALNYLRRGACLGAINLGSNIGYSVGEVVNSAERLVGHTIPKAARQRRAGDPVRLIAGNSRAKEVLGWSPQSSLEEMIQSALVFSTGKMRHLA
ncbi:MAG: UDP-glucose 4-epimerase GalE [Coprothermobacterota bacterium]|nr:UDP-glucose 4-epimerase GalE [Coprothermobacterota bacterium]